MESNDHFDFWYAVNNTRVVLRPEQRLESFGTTTVDYVLITEVMDAAQKIRIREGRVHAYRPQILTPEGMMESLLEGFGESQSEEYVDWLRRHQGELLILKYGFRIRKEEAKSSLAHDKLEAVVDRLTEDIRSRGQTLKALLVGVDEPWEVCLLKLMVELVQNSVTLNATQLRRDPHGHHFEINQAFAAAAQDPDRIQHLADMLHDKNLFSEYEDRFFSLVRSRKH